MDEAAAAAAALLVVVVAGIVVLLTDEICVPTVVDGNVVSGVEMIEEDTAVEMIGEENTEVVVEEAATGVDETFPYFHIVIFVAGSLEIEKILSTGLLSLLASMVFTNCVWQSSVQNPRPRIHSRPNLQSMIPLLFL
jgi:hypothetical protein